MEPIRSHAPNGKSQASELPQAPDAEKGVLASLLLCPAEVLNLCATRNLSGEQFYIPAHRLLFETITTVVTAHKPVDFITVASELRKAERLERIGGAASLNELFVYLPTAANADYYIGAVLDAAKRRRLISVGNALANGAYDPTMDVVALASEARIVTEEIASAALKAEPAALASLRGATLTENALDSLTIPKRKRLLGDFFSESDLGFITAKRGAGKTWLALHMARALADGSACGPWKAHEAVSVLYIDGEMPLDEIRQRTQALRGHGQPSENLSLLSHQSVFDRAERNLCLSEPAFQDAVTKLCEEQGHKVLFLDNQSTLITRVRENSADDWRDMVEGWLLGLRRRRIAVVIINHAGRNGEMRGTSKREDAAFWQIVLDPAEKQGEGARFVSRFTKNRNAAQDPVPLNWHFRPDGDGVLPCFTEADTLQIFRGWVEEGLTRCQDIAEEMGVTKGTVSKLAKRAKDAGWLEIQGREYVITGAQD